MSLVLVIFGLVTFQEIPTDELPDVQPPVVTIQTSIEVLLLKLLIHKLHKKLKILLEALQD